MVWGAISAMASFGIATEAEANANKAASKALLATYNAQKQEALHGYLRLMDKQSMVKMVGSGKCQSCHSREFRQHHGRRVCSYCRSEG